MISQIKVLPNLKLSSEILEFDSALQSKIIITNQDKRFNIAFKIKNNKKQQFFEVKPSKGVLKANSSIEIAIKPLRDLDLVFDIQKQEVSELKQMQQKDKFLIEVVQVDENLTVDQVKDVWKNIKEKKNLNNYKLGIYKLPIRIKSIKSDELESNLKNNLNLDPRASNFRQSVVFKDEDLPRRYQQLKDQEESLLEKREQKIKTPQFTEISPLKLKSIIIMIIALVVGILVGNQVKTRIFPTKKMKKKNFWERASFWISSNKQQHS